MGRDCSGRLVGAGKAVAAGGAGKGTGVRRVGESGQHGGVADLLWDDVKCFFDPDLMGALPDVRVPDASVED